MKLMKNKLAKLFIVILLISGGCGMHKKTFTAEKYRSIIFQETCKDDLVNKLGNPYCTISSDSTEIICYYDHDVKLFGGERHFIVAFKFMNNKLVQKSILKDKFHIISDLLSINDNN